MPEPKLEVNTFRQMFRTGFQVSAIAFLRLLIPLCIGIGIYLFRPFCHLLTIFFLSLAVLLLLIFFKEASFRFQSCWGASLMLVVVIFGFLRASEQSTVFPILTSKLYFAVLDDYPKEKVTRKSRNVTTFPIFWIYNWIPIRSSFSRIRRRPGARISDWNRLSEKSSP